MFSHIVTAAKGLFARQPSQESASTQPSSSPINSSAQSATTANSKMVTATRRRTFSPVRPAAEVNGDGPEKSTGKRKSGATNAAAVEVQVKKRKTSPEPTPEDVTTSEESQPQPNDISEEKPAAPAKKHFRFDSEEPEMPVDIPAEVPEQQPEPAEEDSSDDDEAPEAVDNSAEMSRLRQEAKKQEEIKQREGQLKKEKRKRLDELRKAQAKAANKKKDTLADDLVSESTETLQGSITQDGRRAALPALLPAEILNAAPAVRPPTPPAEGMDFKQKKPNKLKFLEKTEKRPKDVHMGDVTIRVLEDDVSRKKVKTNLPPKASKSGMNSKHNWMNRARSTGQVNGLRRTTGGPSGFVRR